MSLSDIDTMESVSLQEAPPASLSPRWAKVQAPPEPGDGQSAGLGIPTVCLWAYCHRMSLLLLGTLKVNVVKFLKWCWCLSWRQLEFLWFLSRTFHLSSKRLLQFQVGKTLKAGPRPEDQLSTTTRGGRSHFLQKRHPGVYITCTYGLPRFTKSHVKTLRGEETLLWGRECAGQGG